MFFKLSKSLKDSFIGFYTSTITMMEGLESVVAEQDALAHLNSQLKSKAQPSPLKEEFMYTPQKEVDQDELPDIQPPMALHFDDGNTLQAIPFQALGEEEIQQHDSMTLLNSHDEAIEALGSVIDQLVGFTTSLAQHNHGEVGKAFEYLSQQRRVLERLRVKIRRLVDHEENTQEYMGGFDNVLQNYVLPTLKKYSADIPTLLSFKKISESKLSTIEAYLTSIENSLKDWSMEICTTKSTSEYVSQQHDLLSSSVLQLQQRVDQVQESMGPLSTSMGETRSQLNSLQSLSSSVHTLGLRMDSIEGNINSRFSDMESSLKNSFATELGSMESRLRNKFQSQFASFDFARFQQHIEVTNLKLSSFEERLVNVGSLLPFALLSSRLERNEKLLNELQPQIAMTQVWSRRLDTFDAQLNEFRRIQASLPTLDVKVNELESHMSSVLSLTPQFESWNSHLGAVEGDVIGFKLHLELIDNTPPPPPLPSKDGASSTAFDSLHTRVSALESRLNPLHDSFLQCTSRLHALQSSMESHKKVSIRSIEQIREKNSKLEISHGGMRSEFEVVVGKLGVLTARVEEFNGGEFLRRFPINEIARPQLDLLAKTALDAIHSCEAKVQFALENFIVSPEAFQSMFEGCFSHVRSSFCGEVSDLFVNRICESLSTFQPVPTILSRLTKVEEEVSAWAEWKGDETIPPDKAVEVSHTPSSSSAYHGSVVVTRSCGGPGHGILRYTHKQAGRQSTALTGASITLVS